MQVPRRKKEQMSDWEQKHLSQDQLTYAAEDAALTLVCWQRLSISQAPLTEKYLPLYVVSLKGQIKGTSMNESSAEFMTALTSNINLNAAHKSIVPSVLMYA